MTLCKTKNGAQCTCQPDEGVPCALDRYKALGADDELDCVERLRFFCSIVMVNHDWIDVEQFFDAITTERDSLKRERDAALSALEKYRSIEPVAWISYAEMGRLNAGFYEAYCHSKQTAIHQIPLYAHPTEAESDIEEQLRRT